MFSMLPVERSSTTSTVQPRSSRASARCDPMKPAPPVISALDIWVPLVIRTGLPQSLPSKLRELNESHASKTDEQGVNRMAKPRIPKTDQANNEKPQDRKTQEPEAPATTRIQDQGDQAGHGEREQN